MQLIDEEDDLALALLHLVQDGLQPFLKLAAELGTGHQGAHIQREQGLILQVFRYIPGHDPQGQPFGNGGFTYAGFTDKAGVVLALAGKDADDIADLLIPPDDGIELLGACSLGQVAAVFFQHIVGFFRGIAGDGTVAPHLPQRRHEFFLGEPRFPEQGAQGIIGFLKEAEHQVLHGGVLIVHLTGDLFGLVQGLLQVAGEVHLPGAAAGNLGQTLHRGGELLPQGGRLHTGLLHQLGDKPLLLLQQGKQQMLLLDLLILPGGGHLLGGLHGFYTFLGELVEVHKTSSSHGEFACFIRRHSVAQSIPGTAVRFSLLFRGNPAPVPKNTA